MELKIEREFQEKIPPLTEAEFEQLRENILNDGEVYEPIAVWNGIIVDGHNRWKVIQEHPEIPYRIKEMPFADKWEAFDWMYRKQLGRRNLTDAQKETIVGRMYEARKKTHGNNAERGDGGKYLSIQSGYTGEPKRVSEQIAEELGIGKGTVIRAYQFSRGIDALTNVSKEAADMVLNGEAKVTKDTIRELRDMDKPEIEEYAKAIISGEVKQKEKELPARKRVTFPTEKRGNHKPDNVDFDLTISRDRDAAVEYTVADLLEEMRGINNDFLRKYKTMFNFHSQLISDNAADVQKVFDEVKNEIERMEAF